MSRCFGSRQREDGKQGMEARPRVSDCGIHEVTANMEDDREEDDGQNQPA